LRSERGPRARTRYKRNEHHAKLRALKLVFIFCINSNPNAAAPYQPPTLPIFAFFPYPQYGSPSRNYRPLGDFVVKTPLALVIAAAVAPSSPLLLSSTSCTNCSSAIPRSRPYISLVSYHRQYYHYGIDPYKFFLPIARRLVEELSHAYLKAHTDVLSVRRRIHIHSTGQKDHCLLGTRETILSSTASTGMSMPRKYTAP